MKDTFSTYHPIINFTFFCAVIFFSMICLHPVFLAISLSGAVTYSLSLNAKKNLSFIFIYLLPMMLVAGLVNPLFNHRGATILGYLNNNPITMESILYGIAIAVMFGSVILWFSCYNAVMTSDKFIYIFGRIIPALSLIFSMVLRFIPKFKTQIRIVSNGQKCLGRDVSNGTIRDRLRYGIKILSIMVTWALENAIETADSMKSRGYGLHGRTSFSIYRFDARDKGAFVFLLSLILLMAISGALGLNNIQYFPTVKVNVITPFSIVVYSGYFLLCFTPVMRNIWEAIKWQHLQSRI